MHPTRVPGRVLRRVVLSTLAAAGLTAGASVGFAAQIFDPPLTTRPATATQPTTRVALHFQNAPINSILEQLSRDYDFRIPINEAPTSLRINLIAETPVTPQEAIALLNSALRPSGYTAIATGNILKVVSASKGRKLTPVFTGQDPDQIPENDDLRTQVVPVSGLDAVKLRQDLTPLVGSDAEMSANAASNSIVLTDTSSNIKRIVTIIHDLDQHKIGSSDMKVVRLKNADADTAAKLVMQLFNPQQNAQNQATPFPFNFFRRGGGGRGGRGGSPFGGGRGGSPFGGGGNEQEEQASEGQINAAADTRTNTVVVTGPPDQVVVVLDMLHQLDDNPAAEQTFFLIRLKNANAMDTMATLNAMFSGTGSTSGLGTNRGLSSG
ncbi:MAG TPA: secretin N-terminal domain-containing protein, partial [Tepidisphaeraceae bacterium]|nr:secretin N-terminal domain-containing protein [Tepidisphaeraceae bacterium]